MTQLSHREVQEIAELAADRAVSQLFKALGVNINDQKDLNDLRADLIYSRKLRRITETSFGRAMLVLVSMVTVGVVMYLAGSFKKTFGLE